LLSADQQSALVLHEDDPLAVGRNFRKLLLIPFPKRPRFFPLAALAVIKRMRYRSYWIWVSLGSLANREAGWPGGYGSRALARQNTMKLWSGLQKAQVCTKLDRWRPAAAAVSRSPCCTSQYAAGRIEHLAEAPKVIQALVDPVGDALPAVPGTSIEVTTYCRSEKPAT